MFRKGVEDVAQHLQLQLGPPPVSPLGVVPDGVVMLHPNPLRDGTILLHLLREDLLDPEGLEGRHFLPEISNYLKMH